MNVGPSLQALSVFSLSQEITANNVANVSTNEFKAGRLDRETGPEGKGVRAADIRETSEPGGMVPEIQVREDENGNLEQVTEMVESSNTDLSREMVQMIEDEHGMAANAAVIRTMEEMTGNVLDILV